METGSIFGEMNFFDGGARTASVKAATDGVVAVIQYSEMEQLKQSDAAFQLKLTTMLAKATIAILKRISERDHQKKLVEVMKVQSDAEAKEVKCC